MLVCIYTLYVHVHYTLYTVQCMHVNMHIYIVHQNLNSALYYTILLNGVTAVT